MYVCSPLSFDTWEPGILIEGFPEGFSVTIFVEMTRMFCLTGCLNQKTKNKNFATKQFEPQKFGNWIVVSETQLYSRQVFLGTLDHYKPPPVSPYARPQSSAGTVSKSGHSSRNQPMWLA